MTGTLADFGVKAKRQEEAKLSRGFVGFAAHDRFAFAGNDIAGNLHSEDIAVAGHIEHDVEHQPFEEAAKRAGARAFLVRLASEFAQ